MAKKQKKETILPTGDRILIEPLDREVTKSKGGIIIPETVDKERPQKGKVLAVGPGKRGDDNEIIPVALKKGQTVLFAKYSPTEIKIGEKEYLIVGESDILAVID